MSGIAAAVLAGIANMALRGAPASYSAVNATALVIALVIAALLPVPQRHRTVSAALLAGLILLTLPSMLGPSDEGITRWLRLGPIQLHAGMLVVPALLILAIRKGGAATLTLAAAALIMAFQPDAGTTSALALAAIVAALEKRDRWSAVAALGCLAAACAAAMQPDPLRGVPFVEHVLRDAWAAAPLLALALTLMTSAAIGIPLWLHRSTQKGRSEAIAFAAFFLGLIIAAQLKEYPVPLIGYGAAAIIGYGTGMAMLLKHDRA